MKIAIIILNYRTPKLVVDCLRSLDSEIKNCQEVNVSVLVVDNDSNDDSIDVIRSAIDANSWQDWASLIESPTNGGFSAGNNIGIKAAKDADFYLLLNSDTIVREGAISALWKAAKQHPESGLISPRLEWPDGTPQISCFNYHSPISEFIDAACTGPITKLLSPYDVPIPVCDQPSRPNWTSFACVMIRKQVIDQIGLMDEGYFMYYDDVDFCRRAQDAGWQVLHWPNARVVHLRGGSSSVKSDVAFRKRPRKFLYESRSRYFTRFYGRYGLLIANTFWFAGRIISWMREMTGTKQPHTCQFQGIDIWTNWRNPLQTPSILNQQSKV